MTDQEIVAGRGDVAEDSGTLGLIVYGNVNGQLPAIFSSGDLGQGTGALAWLTGDFFGTGNSQIAQPWDNNGTLGLIIYGAIGAPMATVFDSGDLGQGSGALAWLTGDFTGSGRTQIAQPWDNNDTLGLIVYGGDVNDTVLTVLDSGDLGQGPGALAWLMGDFLGWGSAQIAQFWDNNGTLGVNVYAYVDGNVGAVVSSADLGEGSGALAWLMGDFLGTGSPQIAQLWDNNGDLGLIVYGEAGGTLQKVASFPDTKQGSAALAFLTGNFTGSGRAEIAQLWDNNGTLGLIVYGNADGSGWTSFSTPDLAQGSAAAAFLTGDFLARGSDQIAQLWDNNGALALIVYANADTGVQTVFDSPDLGQGPAALAWLTGDFFHLGSIQIAQPWDN